VLDFSQPISQVASQDIEGIRFAAMKAWSTRDGSKSCSKPPAQAELAGEHLESIAPFGGG
jgi:hypothetical protein